MSLLAMYKEKCEFAAIESPVEFEDCQELEIDTEGWQMINEYRNIIEPYLVDGGRYSHISLRGAAAKCDMQIMKVAANLHLLSTPPTPAANYNGSVPTPPTPAAIYNGFIKSAIKIVNDLIEHQFSMLAEKGLAGKNAAHDAIMRMFDNSKTLNDKQIMTSRSKVAPFKDMTGNKYELIRAVLYELVDIGELIRTGDGTKATYTIAPPTPPTPPTPLLSENLDFKGIDGGVGMYTSTYTKENIYHFTN
jgi:hypothetical protein